MAEPSRAYNSYAEAYQQYGGYNTAEQMPSLRASAGAPPIHPTSSTSTVKPPATEQPQGNDQSQKRLGFFYDWNAQFQVALELSHDEPSAALERATILSSLASDFLSVAVTYGKIIISERFLPPKFRTIQPISVGGVAGGEKFIYHGILFKFATDSNGIFSSQEAANKVAGHELKSATRYVEWKEAGVCTPLMCLVDYLGHRLVACSILPIDRATLIYGSSNAGVDTFASNSEFNSLMEKVAKTMNLKGHIAGTMQHTAKRLHAPCDIEGHKGADDRFYLIDFSRTFPPTTPAMGTKERNAFLYQLFRPEFVARYPKPLCSDANSQFQRHDPDKNVHDAEITEATTHLTTTCIQAMVSYVESESRNGRSVRGADLKSAMHRYGINLRYFGLLRSALKESEPRDAVLEECIVRCLRKHLDRKLRAKMESLKTLIMHPYNNLILDFLNGVRGKAPADQLTQFDNDLRASLLRQFPSLLSDEEMQVRFAWRKGVDWPRLFGRLTDMTALMLSDGCWRHLANESFVFVLSDLRGSNPRVKEMHLLSHFTGEALASRAVKAPPLEAHRLFEVSCRHFREALSVVPDSVFLARAFASAVLKHCLLAVKLKDQRIQLRAPDLEKGYALGDRCYKCLEKLSGTQDASELYAWGHFLIGKSLATADGEAFSEAGDRFAAAFRLPKPPHPEIAAWASKYNGTSVAHIVELAGHSPALLSVCSTRCSRLSDATLMIISKHVPLKQLRLRDCGYVTDAGLSAILENCSGSLQNLEVLRCPGITPNGFAKLAKCKLMEVLRLTGFGFNAAVYTSSPMSYTLSVSTPAKSLSLNTLELSNSNSSSSSLPSSLSMSNCSPSGEAGLPYSSLPQLPILGELILYNSLIGNDAMRKIINACPLEDLSMRCCPQLSDALFDPPPNLARVGSLVMLLGNVTDSGLARMFSLPLTTMHSMFIEGMYHVNAALLATLAKSAPNLKKLQFERCSVSLDALPALQEFPILVSVSLSRFTKPRQERAPTAAEAHTAHAASPLRDSNDILRWLASPHHWQPFPSPKDDAIRTSLNSSEASSSAPPSLNTSLNSSDPPLTPHATLPSSSSLLSAPANPPAPALFTNELLLALARPKTTQVQLFLDRSLSVVTAAGVRAFLSKGTNIQLFTLKGCKDLSAAEIDAIVREYPNVSITLDRYGTLHST